MITNPLLPKNHIILFVFIGSKFLHKIPNSSPKNMIGPKRFLIGMFICGALLLLQVQPSFAGGKHGHGQHSAGAEPEPEVEKQPQHHSAAKSGEKKEKEHGHEQHSAGAESEPKGEKEHDSPSVAGESDSEPNGEKMNSTEDSENEELEKTKEGKLDGKKEFKDVVEKDIAQLKEHLGHVAQKGKHSLNKDSDQKEIIKYVRNHLENIKEKCSNKHQQQEQFNLECKRLTQIRKQLVNWLNFLFYLAELKKVDYQYLAVRPRVNKQENGEYKEVELKELLDVFEKGQQPMYSFDNEPECDFIKSLVEKLKDAKQHDNKQRTQEINNEIHEIWEKEEDVLCGKGEEFKEDKHLKKLEKHKADPLVHLIDSPSRMERQQKKWEADNEKNKGKSAEGNTAELEIKGEEEVEEGKAEKLKEKNGEHEKNKKNGKVEEMEEDKEGVGKKVEASESEAASAGSEAVEHPKKAKGAGPEPANGHGHGRTHH